jgi:hypothetical protein
MKHARRDYDRFQDPEGKIPEDEPVFLIRGQDVVAPAVLRYYAECAMDVGADKELVDAVEKHADLMDEWQRSIGAGGNAKVPDADKAVLR